MPDPLLRRTCIQCWRPQCKLKKDNLCRIRTRRRYQAVCAGLKRCPTHVTLSLSTTGTICVTFWTMCATQISHSVLSNGIQRREKLYRKTLILIFAIWLILIKYNKVCEYYISQSENIQKKKKSIWRGKERNRFSSIWWTLWIDS